MSGRRDFDAVAANWDEKPQRVRLAEDVATAIAAHLPLSKAWDLLELGCGTGLVTLKLARYVGSIVGVDGSQGMLERLDEKIRKTGQSNIRTEHRDLERQELPEGPFHMVLAAMLLHHIPDVPQLLHSLRTRLHAGGWIALADLDAEDGSFHEDPVGVFHHGFSREQITELLLQAGFTAVGVVTVSEIVKGERRYPVLLAFAGC